MKVSKQKLIFIGLTIFAFLFVASVPLAANSASVDIGCGKYQYPWCQQSTSGPAGLVNQIYRIAFGLVGACALGVLIYGAILWTLSGAVSGKQDALEWIKAALWGLALLLAAFLILYTINPDLVIDIGSGLDKSINQAPKSSGAAGGATGSWEVNSNNLQNLTAPIDFFGGGASGNGASGSF